MGRTGSVIIQKIVVGPDQKDGFVYAVGKKAYKTGYTISSIHEVKKGRVYDVFIEGGIGEVLWKTFSGVPIAVHHDVEGY